MPGAGAGAGAQAVLVLPQGEGGEEGQGGPVLVLGGQGKELVQQQNGQHRTRYQSWDSSHPQYCLKQ